jgi:hypothetical protein
LTTNGFPKTYWLYLAGGAFIAAGFADSSLIAFHFQKAVTVSQNLIPVFYSVAMGVGALSALLFGPLLDRIGLPILILVFFLSALFAPFVFLGGAGVALHWHDALGTWHGSAGLVTKGPADKRRVRCETKYGIWGFRYRLWHRVVSWQYDAGFLKVFRKDESNSSHHRP